jgi:hypothetical protein
MSDMIVYAFTLIETLLTGVLLCIPTNVWIAASTADRMKKNDVLKLAVVDSYTTT